MQALHCAWPWPDTLHPGVVPGVQQDGCKTLSKEKATLVALMSVWSLMIMWGGQFNLKQ